MLASCSLRPVPLAVLALLGSTLGCAAEPEPAIVESAAAELRLYPDQIDGRILAITEAVNSGELLQADLALERSANPHVHALASEIVVDHTTAQLRQDQLADELDLAPIPGVVSVSLTAQNVLTFQVLSALPDELFDRGYADAQIVIHTQVLVLLDFVLIPTASDPALRDYLLDLREAVAEHLEHALAVRDALD